MRLLSCRGAAPSPGNRPATRPATADQACRALAENISACPHCRPDTTLGILDQPPEERQQIRAATRGCLPPSPPHNGCLR
ncbi:DUF6233 domain-containing protein [Streptomyces sp. AB3(2024)]|uniref:DUF6233 domain-containing protein n=1 Tax=Streptomyces sp. AB3(2024) TaxID=3317321 RepID=UPI0035A3CD5C